MISSTFAEAHSARLQGDEPALSLCGDGAPLLKPSAICASTASPVCMLGLWKGLPYLAWVLSTLPTTIMSVMGGTSPIQLTAASATSSIGGAASVASLCRASLPAQKESLWLVVPRTFPPEEPDGTPSAAYPAAAALRYQNCNLQEGCCGLGPSPPQP